MKKSNTFSTIESIFFYITIVLTTFFIFYPVYLPMVDLPQHASQVAILDDLLKNNSPWVDLVKINWDTPYLLAYLIWLAFHQIFDINTSSKIIVALSFLIYTYSFRLLRQQFQAPQSVEWVALTVFFGLAFQWGFLTFLLATPIGIFFFLAVKNWIHYQNKYYFILYTLLGTLSYFSHILIFCFFCFLSYSYFIACNITDNKEFTWKKRIIFTIPYLIFAFLLYRYANKPDILNTNYYPTGYITHPIYIKVLGLLYMPWNMQPLDHYNIAFITLLILPPFIGLKPRKQIEYYIPLLCFLIIWFTLPRMSFQTGFIYQRFSLFFVPFYYLVWQERKVYKKWDYSLFQLAYIAFFISISGLMFKVYYNNFKFHTDISTKNFIKITQKMDKQKKVLYIMDFFAVSGSLTSKYEYAHFAGWYQAEKQGWVDFNFAAFRPQIVRFKPEKLSSIRPDTFYNSQEDINKLKDCNNYNYILFNTIQSPKTIKIWLKDNPTNCKNLNIKDNFGTWILFENENT